MLHLHCCQINIHKINGEASQISSSFCVFFLCPVGEPINAEAWHWYNEVVGEKRCVIVDTWWQTGKNDIHNFYLLLKSTRCLLSIYLGYFGIGYLDFGWNKRLRLKLFQKL